MRRPSIFFSTAIALILAASSFATAMSADAMDAMPGMGAAAAAAPATNPDTIYTTTGVVETVNREGGRYTIAHEPIPALNLPAMSMRFNLEMPEMIEDAKVGDKVRIDFRGADNIYTILDISVLK